MVIKPRNMLENPPAIVRFFLFSWRPPSSSGISLATPRGIHRGRSQIARWSKSPGYLADGSLELLGTEEVD